MIVDGLELLDGLPTGSTGEVRIAIPYVLHWSVVECHRLLWRPFFVQVYGTLVTGSITTLIVLMPFHYSRCEKCFV